MATKTETELTGLVINYLSESEYQSQLSAGNINENEIYMTPEEDISVEKSGSGNAVTDISVDGNKITATKGSTFLTGHPTITTSTDSTSTVSPSHGGTFTAIDSITRDSNGHVTKVNTKTITLPSDNNTDTKVTQAYSTTNSSYPVLLSATSGVSSTSSRGATTAILNNQIYANPSTGTLTAKTFSGNATTATTLATARTLQTNLASTSSVSFNGSANASIGVTGILPVSNGGTGNSSVDKTPTSGSTKMCTSGGIYDYVSGYLPLSRISIGSVNITPTAPNAITKASVTFGKTFASAPMVFTSPVTSSPGSSCLGTSVNNITTTGCDIYLTRTDTTQTRVYFLAISVS